MTPQNNTENSSQTIVLPLDPPRGEDARLTWNRSLFSVKGALLLPQRITNQNTLQQALNEMSLVFRLTPFKEDLRSKMWAALAEKQAPPSVGIQSIGTVCAIDLNTGKIKISDLRCIKNDEQDVKNNQSGLAEKWDLTNSNDPNSPETQELTAIVQTYVDSFILDQLRELFLTFVPDIPLDWKKDILQFKPDRLVPFGAFIQNPQPIERVVDDTLYIFDDLYCTKPQCPCTDVTCMIIQRDIENPGPEAVFGGFRYDITTGQMKIIPDLPGKFNAKEWFKKFSAESPFELDFLLKARYEFMRGPFIAARGLAASKN